MCKVGRMRNRLVGIAALVLGVSVGSPGCGDNTRACGPKTIEKDGFCVPAATCGFGTREDEETGECVPDGSVVCADGTVFDPLTATCEIDESACQNGTVLIGSACVDPAIGLTIDVQEGPEPNGLGVIEASDAQAGNITLRPVGGDAFVVHGTIAPHRDLDGDGALDPDVDTYVLEVGAPTFVRISADGVNGTAASFVAVAAVEDDAPLAGWQRVGMSLVSDTAARDVFLPSAGRYHIAVADTRSLYEYVTTGSATAAPGGPTSEYYMSLTQVAAPTPTALAVTGGRATSSGTTPSDRLAVFTVPLGNGLTSVELAMPSALADAAFVVLANDMFVTSAVEDDEPARAVISGIAAGTEATIVVDQVHTLVPAALAYTLDVTVTNATPLSTTGGTVMAPATATNGSEFAQLDLFSFDVGAADASVGMSLSISPPVVGHVYDETGDRVATFSPSPSATWTAYGGLVRVPRAGRYYLGVFAPGATSSTMLSVTSTITELEPTPIVKGTPLAASLGALGVAPFAYDAGTSPWQQFDVTGSGTGGQLVSWLDPASAYGRLDALSTSAGSAPAEVTPIFSRTFATSGGPFGRVLLSDPTAAYYVKVNAITPGASPTVTLTFADRAAMVDLGTLASGTGATRTAQTIDSTTPQRFYLFRTAVGNVAMITTTPTSNVNTQFRRVQADESPLGPLVNANNAPDVETFTQTGADWTAFVVSAAGPLSAARTFDVSVQIQ